MPGGRRRLVGVLDRKVREFNTQAVMFSRAIAARLRISKTTVNEILKQRDRQVPLRAGLPGP